MILFTKFSNERSRALSIKTNIISDGGAKKVRKYPAFPEAMNHIHNIARYYTLLGEQFSGTRFEPCPLREEKGYVEFDFLEGESFEKEADSFLFRHREKLNAFLAELFSEIEKTATETFVKTEAFEKVFGKTDLPEGMACMKVTNVDLVLENIINLQGSWKMIDYEWTFDFPVPVKYVEWRILHYYVEGNSKRVFLKDKGIYDLLDVNAGELSAFAKMEESFQQYIRGEHTPLRNLYKDISDGYVNVGEMLLNYNNNEPKKVPHIYYDIHGGFTPEDSCAIEGVEGEEIKTSFKLEGVNRLRFDPSEMPVYLIIDKLETDTGFEIEIEDEDTNGCRISQEEFVFETEDPWIKIKGWPEGSGELILEFRFWIIDKGFAKLLSDKMMDNNIRYANMMRVINAESETIISSRAAASALEGTKPMRAYRKLRGKLGKGDPFLGVQPGFNGTEAGIFFSADQKSYRDDEMFVRGWAYARYAVDESIEIFDANGAKVPAKIERTIRPDITDAFKLYSGRKCGFEAHMDYKDIKALPLTFVVNEPRGAQSFVVELEMDPAKRRERRRLIAEGKIKAPGEPPLMYDDWVRDYMPLPSEIEAQREVHFPYEPLISIVIPLFNTPVPFLKALIDSIMQQSYGRLELCLADASTNDDVENYIKENYSGESRIIYKRLGDNKGISENTNCAIQMASGDFIMFSDHDDIVAKNALFEIVKAINDYEDVDVVYTDEDKIDMEGKILYDPHFKPDFDLDLLRSNNYFCHIVVARKTLVDKVGHLNGDFDGAQDFDYVLRLCEKARRVSHVPMPLYHWRSHPASTAGNPESKLYAYENGRRAVQAHYDRLGLKAKAYMTKYYGRYRSIFEVQGEPLVSIIIPNKDHKEDLKRAIDSIFDKTTYKNYEIIVVENGSTQDDILEYYDEIQNSHENVKVVKFTEPFNYSRVNNFGVANSKGEYLLFLNNDVEVIEPDWMKEMLGYCERKDVGVVGARLLYPDDTVQHVGVIIGLGGAAGHMFYGAPAEAFTYAGRGNSTQDLSAVTAACMMTKREVYEKAGGFDERFVVAFNDADYCLKVRDLGLLVVLNIYAELYHYESVSRGSDKAKDDKERHDRFLKEADAFRAKWPVYFEKGDPYYNPNLDLTRSDFALKWQYPMTEDHEQE